MKYKVYISQVWTYTTEIEADSKEQAQDIAGYIAEDVSPQNDNMRFGEERVEVEEMKMDEKHYKYGMRLRPFGIGCQPKEGLMECTDEKIKRDDGRYYHDVIVYDRQLSAHEIADYELDYLGEA